MVKKFLFRILDCLYRKKGFYSGWGTLWFKDAMAEYKDSSLPKNQKLWALKKGFYPYRIDQYGLTAENYKEFLSDREYKKLYPINNECRVWIDNKLTLRYILAPFGEFLPKHYYHISDKRPCSIMKLIDCPDDCSSTFEDLFKLIKREGTVVLKPIDGSRGIGFCRIDFENDSFYVNSEKKTVDQMLDLFKKLKNHIVTEYVHMHPEINRIYPHSLNTLRVMLINEDGNNPVIPVAYMRIGTKASGNVDNISRGGVFCKIDVETGRFFDGERAVNHVIIPTPNHPDTKEKIEGTIPNWNLVKAKLIEIALYMPQLEYMGIDIAITENGFNIIEINSHQDLHRLNTYPNSLKEYFKRKLISKK